MNRPISIAQPPWTDGQLAEAIRVSTNWRSVMRLLGFGERSSSAGAIRIVRRRAGELGLDWSHFRGKRRWADAQLRQAVAESNSWGEVAGRLGLSAAGGNVQPHLRGHAIRLGLETTHLNAASHVSRQPDAAVPSSALLPYDRKYLRVASESIAATWFTMRGCTVSLPTAPAAYDLLAHTPEGIRTVQVKSTTFSGKDGWMVTVGHHPDTHSKKGHRLAYDPDEINLFFIVDGDMTMYLIPSRAIAGRVGILLRTYRKYIVGNARGLLTATAESEAGTGLPRREPVTTG